MLIKGEVKTMKEKRSDGSEMDCWNNKGKGNKTNNKEMKISFNRVNKNRIS